MSLIKVIICDDHPVVVRGYSALLRDQSACDVIGEVYSGRQLLEILPGLKPDIILLDVHMPGMSGLEAMRIIRSDHPEIRFILTSFNSEVAYVLQCINLGASAYLPKGTDIELVIKAIRHVHSRGFYFSDSHALRVNHIASFNNLQKIKTLLSEREIQVLQLLCDGFQHKQIAGILGISVKTVNFHKENLYKKTGCKSNASLAVYAFNNHLIVNKSNND